MKIVLVTEQGRNPFINAIVSAALYETKSMVISKCFATIEVDEWSEFMNIVMKACSECTRDQRGQWCVERTPVSIVLEDGRVYSSYIWYDVDAKGLRYVSLY